MDVFELRGTRRSAVYLVVQACLGLQSTPLAERVSFTRPALPEMDWLRVINLSVGSATVDLQLTRHAYDVGVSVLRRPATWRSWR